MGLEDLDCGDEAERPAPYIERKQLIPEALFKYTEPISRDSGTAPETEEVAKMEEAYNEGKPLFFYEFMQGQVDFGKMHLPPPRIILEYRDGTRKVFNGEKVEITDDNPITAIEFNNSGPGLRPEECCIFRRGGGPNRLGMHGRGTTVALSFLEKLGISTTVSSNHESQAWKGKTSLRPTDTDLTSVLHLEGVWEKHHSNTTSFRIENPSPRVCSMLNGIGNFFLYANSRFPGVVLVDPDEKAIENAQPRMVIDRGEIMCLDGIVPASDNGYESVWVDALQIKLPYGKCILPWSMSGLSDPENILYKVKRSFDSREISGTGCGKVIPWAVARLENEYLLEKIIETALKNPRAIYYEFDEHNSPAVSEPTKLLVQRIWATKYKNAIITDSETQKTLAKRKISSGQEIMLVPVGLYKFLAQASIKTVDNVFGVREIINGTDKQIIHISFAGDKDRLEKLMQRIARENGKLEILVDGEKKFLQVAFDKAIKSERDLTETSENTTAVTLKIAAVIACLSGIEYKILSVHNEEIQEILLTPHSVPKQDNTFEIEIQIKVSKRNPEIHGHYKDDSTYLILSGDQIDELYSPPGIEGLGEAYFDEKLAAHLRQQLAPKKIRKGGVTKDIEKSDDNDCPEIISHEGVGQIELRPERRPDVGGGNNDTQSENIFPVGYYKSNVGSTLSYDPTKKTFIWTASQKWAKVRIPELESAVGSFETKRTLSNLDSSKSMPLEIKVGHKIIAYEVIPAGSNVTFYREVRTGIYSIKGSAQKITYYTQTDDEAVYDYYLPLPEESENIADVSLLLPGMADFIAYVNGNPGLSTLNKIQLASEMWEKNFKYSDDDALDDQRFGNSREEIAAKMLNTCRGICNISATGFAILLRAIGIPTRIAAGYWNQGDGHGGSHMWVELYNGKRWISIESLMGVENLEKTRKPPGKSGKGSGLKTGSGSKTADGSGEDDTTATVVTNRQIEEIKRQLIKQLRPELEAAIRDELRPVIEQELQPIIEQRLRPIIEGELRPVIKGELWPVIKGLLRPVIKSELRPVVEYELRPGLETAIRDELRPKVEDELRPVVEYELRPLIQREMRVRIIRNTIYALILAAIGGLGIYAAKSSFTPDSTANRNGITSSRKK